MHTAATTRTITNVITGVLSPVCTADFLFDCVTAGLGVAVRISACDTAKATVLSDCVPVSFQLVPSYFCCPKVTFKV